MNSIRVMYTGYVRRHARLNRIRAEKGAWVAFYGAPPFLTARDVGRVNRSKVKPVFVQLFGWVCRYIINQEGPPRGNAV